MMMGPLRWPAINDDVGAEFSYWKSQFVFSLWMATGFAVGAGMLILIWPPGSGSSQLRAFVRDFWPLFVECAFWLGFLIGLLWGAAKRLGSGLSGIFPWQPRDRLSRKAVIARLSGQWASCLALAGIFLWITQKFIAASNVGMATLSADLTPLVQACLLAGAALATVALIGREQGAGS